MTNLDWFWTIAAFLFGSVFGSFLNVCIYRMPLGKSVIWPPSHCPKCFQRVAHGLTSRVSHGLDICPGGG